MRNSNLLPSVFISMLLFATSCSFQKVRFQRELSSLTPKYVDSLCEFPANVDSLKSELRIRFVSGYGKWKSRVLLISLSKNNLWSASLYGFREDGDCYVHFRQELLVSEKWKSLWKDSTRNDLLKMKSTDPLGPRMRQSGYIFAIADGSGYVFDIVIGRHRKHVIYSNPLEYANFYTERGDDYAMSFYEPVLRVISLLESEFGFKFE